MGLQRVGHDWVTFTFTLNLITYVGLPRWLSWQRIHLQCGRPRFDPWLGKIPWRRERLPTPVFWPEEFHGLYSPWYHKETEWLSQERRVSMYSAYLSTWKHKYSRLTYIAPAVIFIVNEWTNFHLLKLFFQDKKKWLLTFYAALSLDFFLSVTMKAHLKK